MKSSHLSESFFNMRKSALDFDFVCSMVQTVILLALRFAPLQIFSQLEQFRISIGEPTNF